MTTAAGVLGMIVSQEIEAVSSGYVLPEVDSGGLAVESGGTSVEDGSPSKVGYGTQYSNGVCLGGTFCTKTCAE